MKKTKRWRDSNPFSQPPGGEKGVPGVLHQPIYQAYKGGLKLGLTRPITASTGACAACSKLYQEVGGSRLTTALSFFSSHVDVGDAYITEKDQQVGVAFKLPQQYMNEKNVYEARTHDLWFRTPAPYH